MTVMKEKIHSTVITVRDYQKKLSKLFKNLCKYVIKNVGSHPTIAHHETSNFISVHKKFTKRKNNGSQ